MYIPIIADYSSISTSTLRPGSPRYIFHFSICIPVGTIPLLVSDPIYINKQYGRSLLQCPLNTVLLVMLHRYADRIQRMPIIQLKIEKPIAYFRRCYYSLFNIR